MPRITITESGKTPQPYRLKIDREETTIGRGSDNAVLIEAGSASTYHCVMKRVPGGFILKDLDSTNGIKLDDVRFEILDLVNDTTVHIGDDVELHFSLSEEEIESLQSEDFQSHSKIMFPKNKTETPPPAEERPIDPDENDLGEIPQRRKKSNESSRTPTTTTKQSSIVTTLVFLALAIVAVVLGLIIRHYQEHGTFLFEKPQKVETPANSTE